MAMDRLQNAVIAFVVVLTTLAAAGLAGRVGGVSLDALYLLSEWVHGPRPAPGNGEVVVVALDEETYRRPPFVGTPQALWPPYLAPVFSAIHDGGAKVIGVDLVYPTSVQSIIPGFEREFLVTLRRIGRDGGLVLAKVQHQTQPLLPFRGQMIAVGGGANVRSVNLVEDDDGVLRRVPLTLSAPGPDGTVVEEAGFALELATRAAPGGAVTRPEGAGGGGDDTLLVNHPTAAGAIPTYSLADLYACAEKGDTGFFERNFRDKVVLVGTVLDVEDRKLSSNRWVTKPEGTYGTERCALPEMPGLSDGTSTRDSVPGVYIHAAAVGNLLAGNALDPVTGWPAWAMTLALAGLAALATMALPPGLAGGAIVALCLIWTGAAVAAFQGDVVLPWLRGLIAAVPVFPLLLAFRFTVIERDQRQIRRAFKLYLPSELIDDMIRDGVSPSLGGEKRTISILFSDIAGYTAMSEGLPPDELVAILNRYFTVMTDIITRNGGFVDKYIGDAILAVFGAPYCRTNHATAAVDAALAMNAALTADPTLLADSKGRPGTIRIGIATGEAVIGNIGSPQRFNYTVMGDTVNLASRLEGANKAFRSAVLVADGTVAVHGDPSLFREVDTVQVVGRAEPVTLFEPLSLVRLADPEDAARRAAYADALAAWREGRFAAAAAAFGTLSAVDPVAATMARKAERRRDQPPEEWSGVTALTEK